MNFFLQGDHSNVHVGCSAGWRRLIQLIEKKPGARIVSTISECDYVIVNGEGTMHDRGHGSLSKLKTGYKARKKGKKAYLINSVWQNMNSCSSCGWGVEHEKYLKSFNKVCVRDIISFNEIKNIRPDTKIFTDLAYDLPVKLPVHRGNKKVYGDFFNKPDNMRNLFPKKEYTSFRITKFPTWETYLHALSEASLYVTGKHHEFIAACKLRIPFVAYRGNTDKVLGVINRAKANIPVAGTAAELQFNINNPPDIKEYNKLFNFLEKQKPFTLEDLCI